ncbi:Uncharacterised protein [Mycobacterium tuberculosis]|nr:Uncharacterised protein [Mycobacterium tuberculosis]
MGSSGGLAASSLTMLSTHRLVASDTGASVPAGGSIIEVIGSEYGPSAPPDGCGAPGGGGVGPSCLKKSTS